jgi:hypothetical protein
VQTFSRQEVAKTWRWDAGRYGTLSDTSAGYGAEREETEGDSPFQRGKGVLQTLKLAEAHKRMCGRKRKPTSGGRCEGLEGV